MRGSRRRGRRAAATACSPISEHHLATSSTAPNPCSSSRRLDALLRPLVRQGAARRGARPLSECPRSARSPVAAASTPSRRRSSPSGRRHRRPGSGAECGWVRSELVRHPRPAPLSDSQRLEPPAVDAALPALGGRVVHPDRATGGTDADPQRARTGAGQSWRPLAKRSPLPPQVSGELGVSST
jgi:hypothetical protein